MSLTKADLKAIQAIVDDSIDRKVPPIVRRVITEEVDPKFDDLTQRIGAGFNEMSERFAAVDARFDIVDARLDRVKERLTNVELEVSRLNGNILGLRKRVDDHDKSLAKLSTKTV